MGPSIPITTPVSADLALLVSWFCRERRLLPWRRSPNPYAIWISEVMLQQTQVATVIPYFQRWMARFPTIESLASAPLEEVIKLWEGLGYYSRARNLHAGAIQLMTGFHGKIPRQERELLQIKGMGPYTAAAVRAFAFGERCVAVDGNVARVGARYFGITEEISKQSVKRRLGQEWERWLPERSPELAAEGLIELGATLCLPRAPKCDSCPLQAGCYARRNGLQAELPKVAKRAETISLRRLVALLICNKHLLLFCGERGRVMAGLYQFPYFDWSGEEPSEADLTALLRDSYPLALGEPRPLTPVQHSFTRYRVRLLPWLLPVKQAIEIPGLEWRSLEECRSLPFAAGHRALLQQVVTCGCC